MSISLRILIVEDSEDDAHLLLKELRHSGYDLTFDRVDTLDAMAKTLDQQEWDIVISDYFMSNFSWVDALKVLKKSKQDLPFIILSSVVGKEKAVEAMRDGAHDYIMKDDMARLVPTIERELREAVSRRERERTEEQLRENKRRLEETLEELKATQKQIVQQERLRALGQMASGIAHDFNNTLTPVLGYTELMLMVSNILDDTEKVKSYMKLINTAAKDAKKIVGRLREFYRHREEDEMFLPIRPNKLVEQIIELTMPKWKEQAQANGITISIKPELQKVKYVVGNETELREVLTNLVFNAVDAMEKDGTITIRTYPNNKYVVIEVNDTGMGMIEEVKQHCFDPFFSTKGEHGTGLGLATVYGIIQRHKGNIEIKSRPGEGTTFTIRLPIYVKQQDRKSMLETRKFLRSLHVLVVDDQQVIRYMIAEYLTADGHTVETATNGREGLEKFHAGRFDLVITNQSMPDINGTQLAKLIKEIVPNKPIILLTGFADMMESTGEKPTCIDLIVSKPVTIATFRDVLEKVANDFGLV